MFFPSIPPSAQSEPLGPLLALLAGFFKEDLRAVYASSGLIDFKSVLESQLVLIPHAATLPGLLAVADIPNLI